jgi:hypothetical protein
MALFDVINTGSAQDTWYQGMVKAAANWALMEAYFTGTANHKLFLNAAGTAMELAAGCKVVTATRAYDAATGNQAITGVGFKPSVIIGSAMITNSLMGCLFVLTSGGGTGWALSNYGYATPGNWSNTTTVREAADKYQAITLASMDADGVTLTFTRTGTTSAGTIAIALLCLR